VYHVLTCSSHSIPCYVKDVVAQDSASLMEWNVEYAH